MLFLFSDIQMDSLQVGCPIVPKIHNERSTALQEAKLLMLSRQMTYIH
ncbi:hypothetical protein SBF1_6700002 [Candidatus Desulfosporosinus infrequens]|uniref:Uncharacterized protein n=1 Tax=Candidatus Desulfosporosinus infrequens TaxID=2043169 RepID=A0A2U3LNU1_9FIRM|nr:hypothetical protein SBF1_6700002 [Candidatus Desulfosporosinus infrequens]